MKHFKGKLLPPNGYYEKICRIMKITAVLLFAAIFQTNATGFSQTVFSFNRSSASVKKIIRELEEKSDYSVFYRQDQLDINRKISLSVKNVPIDSLMKEILAGQPVVFKIIGKVIVIKPVAENVAEEKNDAIPVSGTVYSTIGSKPLAGITVREKNTGNATMTDANGHFTIKVKDNEAILIFQAINYKLTELKVGEKRVFDIYLDEDIKTLNEVVVVGYGSQQKKDLTGAVAVIGSKELEDRPNTQFGYSIEGKAAGVQVIRSSGQPQAGFSIKVRGTSSITSGSDPIYVVDGVQTYSTNEINPADIESITVLKDASSAAIYGSGGANGVVLITTKHGKNQKTKLNFNTSITSSQAWKKLPVLNSSQYQDLMTEMGISINWANYTANTNWQDQVFRNAQTKSYNLSAAGGNENTQYYMSGSLVDQQGIVLNNSVKRATFKLNLDHKVNNWLKLGTNISYDHWSDVDVPENDRNGVISRLITAVPIIGVWDPKNPNQYATSPVAPVDIENPVSVVYQPEHLYTNNRFHGNAYAELSIIPGLKFKSMLGLEHSNSIFTSFQNSIQTIYGRSMDGLAAEDDINYDYWVSENTLNYNKKIGDHSFSVLAGFIASKQSSREVYLSSHGFGGSSAITTVTAGTVQSIPKVTIDELSKASFIGRLNYSYKDKYLLTSNFRADGSGKFPPKNKWGYFPSFSAGWRISNEEFFKEVTGINDLKLRAGWGIVGNDQLPSYAWYGTLSPSSYVIGGKSANAYVPNTLPQDALRWETTKQFNIGIDLTILKNRLNVTTDYYNKRTTALLLNTPIPASVGVPGNTAWQNAGSIENKGFEFQVVSRNIVKSDFSWTTDFNIYFNKGKVLDIVGTTVYTGGINPNGSTYDVAIVKAGLPLGSFYGKYSQGVDPATGNIKYLQQKGGGDSLGVIGNANPKYAYGLTNSFAYKNFSLDIFLQGVQGNQIFNGTKILSEAMSVGENQSATVLNRWKKAGDITSIPKSTLQDESNVYPSSRFVENGSYLRVKSVTLGYNLPATLLNKIKISRCLFYFTAENLFTFTKYTGFDPEVSMFNPSAYKMDKTSQNAAPGVDFGTYPQSRDFILGLSVTF